MTGTEILSAHQTMMTNNRRVLRPTVALLLLLGLASCTDKAVKDAVRDDLVDPDSAQFGRVSFNDDRTWACVEVNAKNRMGGYTGEVQTVLQKEGGHWRVYGSSAIAHEQCVKSIRNEL